MPGPTDRRAARRTRRHHREPPRRARPGEHPDGHPAAADARLGRRALRGEGLMRRVPFVLLRLLAAACAPRHVAGPKDQAAAPAGVYDEARIAALHRARTGPGVGDYCLGAGDLLTVNVFGWDAMRDQQVRVSSTGAITLPMLGDIPAAGKTETELRAEIESRLRNGYMRDPHVTVFVQRDRP